MRPAATPVQETTMQRRDFMTGMVAGAVAGVGGRMGWERLRPESAGLIPKHARLSFSAQGEDIVLYHAVTETMKIEKPTYMDVGAADPIAANNTYLLYHTAGAHGILVEPNPMFVKMLREERPRDVTVAAGIGVTETTEADYYEIKDNPWLNTFSPDEAKDRQKQGQVVERVTKMPLLNINKVIEQHLGKAPDLLSTDVEGLDFAILKTLDLERFRPAVICAEDTEVWNSGKTSDLAKYLGANGYIPRGGSMYNAIYLDAKRLT
jgi:FkbM family methyltransferase